MTLQDSERLQIEVILSAAKNLWQTRERSFAALRMTVVAASWNHLRS
jgi:hypothetical protein